MTRRFTKADRTDIDNAVTKRRNEGGGDYTQAVYLAGIAQGRRAGIEEAASHFDGLGIDSTWTAEGVAAAIRALIER